MPGWHESVFLTRLLIDRDLGGQPSDPFTVGIFALPLIALTVWRSRATGTLSTADAGGARGAV